MSRPMRHGSRRYRRDRWCCGGRRRQRRPQWRRRSLRRTCCEPLRRRSQWYSRPGCGGTRSPMSGARRTGNCAPRAAETMRAPRAMRCSIGSAWYRGTQRRRWCKASAPDGVLMLELNSRRWTRPSTAGVHGMEGSSGGACGPGCARRLRGAQRLRRRYRLSSGCSRQLPRTAGLLDNERLITSRGRTP